MSFIERVAARVFMAIFDRAWEMMSGHMTSKLDAEKIVIKHDKVRDDLVEELAAAGTTEEIDAILDRMVDYKPRV